ncbi:30S ribosomal protein S4 [Patescibacteria group bacterium]|nr:30S ribosomal protein S4 [Patescibacteria group bacterium]
MKRKHKKYSKPKRPFDKERIDEEVKIKEEFGLKNKKEIWRADAKIKLIREKAKKLIPAEQKDRELFFEKLKKMGLEVKSIADVLSLEKRDYLQRRLQTIVVKKRLATTPKNARQFIVHKKILVNGRVVDSPSYIVPKNLEDKISLIKKEIKKTVPVTKNAEGD